LLHDEAHLRELQLLNEGVVHHGAREIDDEFRQHVAVPREIG